MKNMTANTKLFIAAIVTAGALALASGLMRWESKDPVRFLSFLIVAAIASRLKVKLPGTTGNLSVNLPFILIALAELSFSETVVMAAVSAFVQGLPAIGRRIKPVQSAFNVATLVLAAAAAQFVCSRAAMIPSLTAKSLLIALAGAAFLVADTLPIAGVISLTENLKLGRVWREMLELTFSYFVSERRYRGHRSDRHGLRRMADAAARAAGDDRNLRLLPALFPIPGGCCHHQPAVRDSACRCPREGAGCSGVHAHTVMTWLDAGLQRPAPARSIVSRMLRDSHPPMREVTNGRCPTAITLVCSRG